MEEIGTLSSVRSDQKTRVLNGRHTAIWDSMRDEGYAALVIAGRGLLTQYGYLEYVAGFCPQVRLAYAVIVPGIQPILVMPTTSDAWYAREATGLSDVRAVGQGDVVSEQDSLPQAVADIVKEHGANAGKVGIVGVRHIMPAGDYEMLRDALPEAQLADATALLGAVKMVKSREEQQEVMRSAAIVDAGLEAFMAAAAVGESGWELRGVIENVVRSRGAQHVLVMISGAPYFNNPPGNEMLTEGDLVTTYVELTGPNGFWVEKASLFAISGISDEKRRLGQVCLDSHAAAAQALTIGNTAGAVATAIEKVASPAGVEFGIWHGHGVGVDHDMPVLTENDTTPLKEGMVIAVHPNFVNREETIGASVADTYVVTREGPIRGSRIAQEIRTI